MSEMKALVLINSIANILHEKVISKVMEPMTYNLNIQCEMEDKCPFKQLKIDIAKFA